MSESGFGSADAVMAVGETGILGLFLLDHRWMRAARPGVSDRVTLTEVGPGVNDTLQAVGAHPANGISVTSAEVPSPIRYA